MKLLGLTCGRKMGNSEILVKEALMGAEEFSGVEAELIRLLDLNIKPCQGCESCVASLHRGGSGECVIKGDDMPFFLEKFTECDGLILGAPVYFFQPPGLIRVINDRMVGYDMKLVMEPPKKERVGGLISVGGTDFIYMGLPLMNTLLQPAQVKIVDQLQVAFAVRPGQVLLDEEAMKRARRLGFNVAEAMGKPVSEVKFMGDEPGQCPICHSNILVVCKKPPIRCAICGSRGVLKMMGDEITVIFDEEDIKKPHWSSQAFSEHVKVIGKLHETAEQRKDEIQKKSEKYKSYKSYSLPHHKAG
jgi:multimeric flavodoxin WrbA/DNA-directed RNA polymerase subunit RPC12/RpoP